MDVKEAVRTAKQYVAEVFADEQLTNLGLEEIWRDDDGWSVTIGFNRPWNKPQNDAPAFAGLGPVDRSYRVVKIRDSDGQVASVTRRSDVLA